MFTASVGRKQDKAGRWRLVKVPYYSTNLIHANAIEERMNQLGRLEQYKTELYRLTRSKSFPSFLATPEQRCRAAIKSGGTIRPGHSTTEIRRRTVTIEVMRRAFLWCTIINYGILLVWFLFFKLGHDWMYGLHGRWFHLSVEQFDMLHYAGMSVYKIGIILLNLVPYFALRITEPRT